MKKRMFIMLICVGILFGSIFAFQIFKANMIKKAMSANQAPAVSVSSTVAQINSWQPLLKATGSMRAYRGVDVTTEIAGLVRSIEFTPGAQVKSGQLLVKLNDDSEVAQLQSLQAAAELAKINYNRDKAQYAAEAISKAILDADISNVKATEAQVKQQQAIIAKKNILAPFAGRLGITTVNPGQYLNPGDMIVTLQALDPIFIDFYLPQQDFTKISLGQNIIIKSDIYPGKTFQGKITTINPKIDTATRNVQVEATVANPKQMLLPGLFANVEIYTGKPQSLITLPQTAITFNPYGDMVFIIQKTEAKTLIALQTPVSLGETRGDQIAILHGVKEGDTVVTSGQMKLKNKSTVTINNSVIPGNNPAPKPVDQ
jgi:membrane fusion protein (multidrug efflux system)